MKQSFLFFAILALCTLGCEDDDIFSPPGSGKDLQFLIGEWSGEFDQDGFGVYPMEMEVTQVNDQSFSGELRWPSLRNSITTMEGFFRNDTLFWTETELLQGSGIVLDGNYIVPFREEEELTGSWFYPNQPENSGGTFTITK
jgi:hypothetical protein